MHQDVSTLPGRGPLIVACAECQQPLRIFPSFLKTRPHPTCSRACRDARRTRQAREQHSRPCVVCGTVFYRAPSSFEKEGRKTCGLRCRAVWQTGRKLAAPDSLLRRFEQYRVIQGGCYGWTGATSDGYGTLGSENQRNVYVHRLAWEIATGETLTSVDFIGHVCDNPPCTRNDDEGTYEVRGVLLPRRGHLFKGTNADNVRDMWQKGRERRIGSKGESHPRAKLTESDVRAIRTDLAIGVHPRVLAERHDVSVTLIRLIGQRQAWAHIK